MADANFYSRVAKGICDLCFRRAGRHGPCAAYDARAQSPFFRYYDDAGKEHEVWFEDARSIQAKLRLVEKYRLGGVAWWTVNRWFAQNWAVLESMFKVNKRFS